MKFKGLPLLVPLLIAFVAVPVTYLSYTTWGTNSEPDFYFGVSYGLNSTQGAKSLIDKVKDYTNLFLINSWDITINESALTEVADYAADADLHFMVYFSFISNQTYSWHQTWLDNAEHRWGDKFLGVYLYDEPGGWQIEQGQWNNGTTVKKLFQNTSSPQEAAEKFVGLGTSPNYNSMNDLKRRGIPAFTSDFALYWYDYMAGYSSVFVELGWNNSRVQQIALCRGAAQSMGRDWGAIITWTYMQPPYIASGPEILQDMHTAYEAGAKYITVFDWAKNAEGNAHSILTEEHFAAMQQFWNYTQNTPQDTQTIEAKVALMLPEYYGGGLRWADDNVWGPTNLTWRASWPEDTQTPLIWTNLNKLSDEYGLELNVIFDGHHTADLMKQYSKVYLWNENITNPQP
ncbi:MAG: hypothetical protein NWF00_01200 [Candidatus Bathyarchaeota archaeon]|nr:hypothetical protein [Candidatus Bathyarchaeota archaeon]